MANLGQMFVDANDEVVWHDPEGGGYTLLELSADAASATFFKVSDVTQPTYTVSKIASFEASADEVGKLSPSE